MAGRESIEGLCRRFRAAAQEPGLGKERRRQPFSSAAIVDARVDTFREKVLHGALPFVQHPDGGAVRIDDLASHAEKLFDHARWIALGHHVHHDFDQSGKA